MQQNLLDGSLTSTDGAGTESLGGSDMIAAMQKEYAELQERFQVVQETCESLRGAEDKAKRQAADFQERLQSTELQVVSLKLELESKQAELDHLCGKVSRLEQKLSSNADADERSSATTARVTPTRGSERAATDGVSLSETDAQVHLAALEKELDSVRRQLEECQSKLKEKARMDWARLTVRCHKSVVRREEEHERQTDLESQVESVKEASDARLCELQKQLVDKTNALLACEKKFAQLLAWAQKNKQTI